MQFGADAALLGEVVAAAKAAARRRPLIVKLSPNVTDIAAKARAAERAGADAVSLINTLQGLAVDAAARTPRLGGGYGGLSGPAVSRWPCAWRIRLRKPFRYRSSAWAALPAAKTAARIPPLRRVGGAGGNGLVLGPCPPAAAARELDDFLEKHKIASAAELIGALRMPGT